MLYSNTNFKECPELFRKVAKCLDYIYSGKLDDAAVGKYQLEDGCFVMVQEYETIPFSGRYEAHAKYLDIQYIAKGSEVFKVAPLKALNITEPFVEGKDNQFGVLTDEKYNTDVLLCENDAIVVFPDEGHAPKCWDKQAGQVRKYVVKVPIA